MVQARLKAHNGVIYEYGEEEAPHSIDQVSADFLDRLHSTKVTKRELELVREDFGDELPEDVIEQLARQQTLARPMLEQYHMIHENTPTLAMARAANMKTLDEILDVVTAMDLTDIGDVGDFADEYTCPKCAHRWSGAPNYRTGYGDKVYIPTGHISHKTGRVLNKRYGPPIKTVRNFKYGREWRGASAAKLPRGYGNRPIGKPIVGKSWRNKKVG